MKSYPMIGKHICYFEAPDTIFMRLIGEVGAKEGRHINDRHIEIGQRLPNMFFLIDLGELDGIHPDVRKEAGEILKRLPLRGAAIYQASFKSKVIAKLILTAMNMFRSEEEKVPIVFFETEEAARAWIEAKREESLAAASDTVAA